MKTEPAALARMPDALATRRRLLDAPAGPLLSLVPLLPRSGGLALVDVLPLPDGGAVARFASKTAVGEITLPDATAEQTVTVPAGVLRSMARRHADAVRIAADRLPSGGLIWRSLSDQTALSLQTAEAPQPLPAVLADRTVETALDDPYPLLFAPQTLVLVMKLAQTLSRAPLRLLPIWDGSPAGCELAWEADGPDAVAGWCRVARCADVGDAPEG